MQPPPLSTPLPPTAAWSISVSAPTAALSRLPHLLPPAVCARAHASNPAPAPLALPLSPRAIDPLSNTLRRGSSVPAALAESLTGEALRTLFPTCSSPASSLRRCARLCGGAHARAASLSPPPTLGNPPAIPKQWPVAPLSRLVRSRGASPPSTGSDRRSSSPAFC